MVEGMTIPGYDAIILSGGRASRLGSPKQRLAYAGATLLERACAACTTARAVVVAGPTEIDPPAGVRFAPEDPPFGGPVAGIASGLAALATTGERADWVLVLAVDHPELPAAVPALLSALPEATPEVDSVLLEHRGEPQILLGAHRTASLHRALAALGRTRDVSVRRLQADLRRTTVTVTDVDLSDVDTPADAARFGIDLD
ncbi:molybdopterin-guanine dinucleotide biosynthesis protein [Enemella evansiae]|nr:molybdopterin-guanine dinucleotide biosynthesis protein [Enemella evansiae]